MYQDSTVYRTEQFRSWLFGGVLARPPGSRCETVGKLDNLVTTLMKGPRILQPCDVMDAHATWLIMFWSTSL